MSPPSRRSDFPSGSGRSGSAGKLVRGTTPHPPEALFAEMLRAARELLAVRSPLDAELMVSELLGTWWRQQPGRGRRNGRAPARRRTDVEELVGAGGVTPQVGKLLAYGQDLGGSDGQRNTFSRVDPPDARGLLESALIVTETIAEPAVSKSFPSYHAFIRARIRTLPPTQASNYSRAPAAGRTLAASTPRPAPPPPPPPPPARP